MNTYVFAGNGRNPAIRANSANEAWRRIRTEQPGPWTLIRIEWSDGRKTDLSQTPMTPDTYLPEQDTEVCYYCGGDGEDPHGAEPECPICEKGYIK